MTVLPSGSIATKSNTIRFSVRELYAGRVFFNDFTTRVNSYIGTIVVPDKLRGRTDVHTYYVGS